MRWRHGLASIALSAVLTLAGIWLLTPWIFVGRVMPGVMLADHSLTGLPQNALPDFVRFWENKVLAQPVRLTLRDKEISRSLGDIGASLNRTETTRAILLTSQKARGGPAHYVTPDFTVDQSAIAGLAEQEFSHDLTLARDATLAVSPVNRSIIVKPSASGETIDLTSLAADIEWRAELNDWVNPIDLAVISAPASVDESEVVQAQKFAVGLLRSGWSITDGAANWTMPPAAIARLLRFEPVADAVKPDNKILGVTFSGPELSQYLATTIAPAVDQPAINARFERVDDRVTQFAAPQAGRALNLDASVASIQRAALAYQSTATIIVEAKEPDVKEIADIESFGITELLAVGASTYDHSPANRIHNINVGTKRYHGLLIKPGQDFSFNEFLGPVDGAHGFKPELVIKKNVTIPEFGGGLCQVSTTLFRAAVNAGLKITARRNHAYAVTYYGTPGFDATIYPPYTDLRFTNNTPGYVLIQAKNEGAKLVFEFWGTSDGREVVIDGPHPYERAPDGAVKATLAQKVTRDNELIIDDKFYSRYKSPKLFPKPNAALAPAPIPAPSPTFAPS